MINGKFTSWDTWMAIFKLMGIHAAISWQDISKHSCPPYCLPLSIKPQMELPLISTLTGTSLKVSISLTFSDFLSNNGLNMRCLLKIMKQIQSTMIICYPGDGMHIVLLFCFFFHLHILTYNWRLFWSSLWVGTEHSRHQIFSTKEIYYPEEQVRMRGDGGGCL